MAEHDLVVRNVAMIGGTGDPRRIATGDLPGRLVRCARSAPNR